MTKYFDNPDLSFDDSFQGPLQDIDLNDSSSFLELAPKRSIKSRNAQTSFGRNTSFSGKENSTDTEKLAVFHKGQYGEQFGTLIVRHYVQRDSKCIQCRNCGIFFNTTAFLMHCHDQYGKRSQCNGIHLQLALDNPTNRQKDVWNRFQKKLLSEKSSYPDMRPDSAAAKHIQNLDKPSKTRYLTDRDQNSQRKSECSTAEVPIKNFNSAYLLDPPFRRKDDTLERSRRFYSSSALNLPDSLSLSELAPTRRSDKMFSSQTKIDRDAHRNIERSDPSSCWRDVNNLLPDRFQKPSHSSFFQSAPSDRYDFYQRKPETIGMGIPIENLSLSNPDPILLTQRLLEPPSRCITETGSTKYNFTPIPDENGSKSDANPKDLISQACILLQKASDRISKDQGQNSNAWRKMYEEERDHRMRLEAKVRDMERELRSRKT